MAKSSTSRRNVLKKTGLLAGAGIGSSISGCSGGTTGDGEGESTDAGGTPGSESYEVTILEPEGSLSTIYYLMAQEEGIFRDHNIDLSLEITSFDKYSRVFLGDLSKMNGLNPFSLAQTINEGIDVYYMDGHENTINMLFAHVDSDIQEIPDLANHRLGVPFDTSSATLVNRVIGIEKYDFDIMEDTEETISSDPNSLWSLFESREIDAMVQFSGQSITGLVHESQNELIRTIQRPIPDWEDVTGHPPATTVVAGQKEWVDQNPGVVLRYLEAHEEAIANFQANAEDGVERYGALAGIMGDTAKEIVVDEFVASGNLYSTGPDSWTEGYVDAQWQIFEKVRELGAMGPIPDKDSYVLYRSDLEEMAGN